MFDNNDFEHIKKMKNEMADGITDASSHHEILESVVDLLSNIDYGSDESRMELMMQSINMCYDNINGEISLDEDRVFGVVLGLCFCLSNIVSNIETSGFSVADYFGVIKSEILPTMKEESKALPYWDLDDE